MRCDLRWMHDPVVVVAISDGETQCSKVRSDEVLDGPSLRSQAGQAEAVSPIAEQKAMIRLPPPTIRH